MAFIGKKPTNAALTSSDIADDIITEAKMANDAISLTELKAGTDGELITWDASGNPVAVAAGTSGHYLKSQGAGSVPVFAAVSAGNNTPVFLVTKSGSQSVTRDGNTKITWDTETIDSDGAFASDKFTVPTGEGGRYAIFCRLENGGSGSGKLRFYKNGSQWNYFTPISNTYSSSGFEIMSLAEDDYIEMYAQVGEPSPNVESNSHFGGFKILE
jgi:hypothetical protein